MVPNSIYLSKKTVKDIDFSKIYKKYEDASVSLVINDNTSSYVCSGWFIDYSDPIGNKGYVVTAAHCVLAGNRNQRYSEIFGLVTNVNGTGIDITYNMKVIGVDGSNDIAVLHPIDSADEYINLNLQKSLTFGYSINTLPGSQMCIIGNPVGIDNQSITVGVVRDNSFTLTNGNQPCESLMTDSSISGGNSGSPILNSDGNVIGLLTLGYGYPVDDVNGGPSQRILQPIVERIIDGMGTESVWTDNLGNYSKKGFLGIHFKNITLNDINNWNGIGTWNRCGVYVEDAMSPGTDLKNKIIVSINDIKVGDIQGQIAPGTITSLLPSNEVIKVTYIDPLDINKEMIINITLGVFPLDNDIPLSSGINL